MLDSPPDIELPILIDSLDHYPREEDFDGPTINDICTVGGGHLTFEDGSNAVPEGLVLVNDDRAYDIITIEDNDFINNEMVSWEPT